MDPKALEQQAKQMGGNCPAAWVALVCPGSLGPARERMIRTHFAWINSAGGT